MDNWPKVSSWPSKDKLREYLIEIMNIAKPQKKTIKNNFKTINQLAIIGKSIAADPKRYEMKSKRVFNSYFIDLLNDVTGIY